MSDKQRNPKLEIEINMPVVLTIGKKFWEGTNKWGKSFGYEVTYNGSEHTFFASEFVHERFQSFGQGTTVKVIKRQPAGQKNAHWEIGEINGNGNSHAPAQNAATSQPAPKYQPSTFDRDAYREQRIARMAEALYDAHEVAIAIETQFDLKLSTEDLRSMAISFVIEEQRAGVPLKPVEKPPDANIPALLEEIKKELTEYVPGHADEDKTLKADLLDHALSVRKWDLVTQMNGQQLIEGLAALKARIAELKAQSESEDEEDDGIPF